MGQGSPVDYATQAKILAAYAHYGTYTRTASALTEAGSNVSPNTVKKVVLAHPDAVRDNREMIRTREIMQLDLIIDDLLSSRHLADPAELKGMKPKDKAILTGILIDKREKLEGVEHTRTPDSLSPTERDLAERFIATVRELAAQATTGPPDAITAEYEVLAEPDPASPPPGPRLLLDEPTDEPPTPG